MRNGGLRIPSVQGFVFNVGSNANNKYKVGRRTADPTFAPPLDGVYVFIFRPTFVCTGQWNPTRLSASPCVVVLFYSHFLFLFFSFFFLPPSTEQICSAKSLFSRLELFPLSKRMANTCAPARGPNTTILGIPWVAATLAFQARLHADLRAWINAKKSTIQQRKTLCSIQQRGIQQRKFL